MPLQKALRRASRKAFMWPEEAASIIQQGRSLTELPAVGPTVDRIIRSWLENTSDVPTPPTIRQHFLTATESRATLDANPDWLRVLKGDLQMHTVWSDGSGSIEDMALAAVERGYEFIAITDHSKGLKIAGGIDEAQLEQQGAEICNVNAKLKSEGYRLQVLRSIELNIDPRGKGDMDSQALSTLDLVLGCFQRYARKRTKRSATSPRFAIPTSTSWDTRAVASTITASDSTRTGNGSSPLLSNWTRQSRSTAIPIARILVLIS